ncbi:MAG: Rrf2 family transcriptional regulator [Clostridiales bacterium]|jgi:Rrf2 family protein|nr:Rrf2 family transcriptional regulator [Clostridiales bacterium]
MRISTRGRYGLKALLDIAAKPGGKRVNVAGIAKRHSISEAYLEQLVATLKKHGFVTSVRGAGGGYDLLRPPNEVSVAEVLNALEEPAPRCFDSDEPDGCRVGSCDQCTTKPVWEKLYGSVNEVLESYTLADLITTKPKED